MTRAQLKFLRHLLNDWMAYYAPDMCESLTVEEAHIRAKENGSWLAYTADGIKMIDDALKETI